MENAKNDKTLEDAAKDYVKSIFDNGIPLAMQSIFIKGAEWQAEQDSNWFNQYQEVENYIINRIGDNFLEATPEKYETASQATIALLEANWQSERMYSEEEVYELLLKHQSAYRSSVRSTPTLDWSFDIKKWFEQFKKK